MEDLKNYRDKELKSYLIAQVLIFAYFYSADITAFLTNWKVGLVQFISSTLLSSSLCIFTYVIDAMFGDKVKSKLLFLISRLPGEKIFTKIKKKDFDVRYSSKEAQKKYSEIYNNMPTEKEEKYKYENVHWYKIYSHCRVETMIRKSHREYLMCRDIYTSTLIILLLYFLLVIISPQIAFSKMYLIFQLVVIVVTNIAARQKASRFVENVIASDMDDLD